MREKPTIVLFADWRSTTAPRPPTAQRSTSLSVAGSKAETVPISGAATYGPHRDAAPVRPQPPRHKNGGEHHLGAPARGAPQKSPAVVRDREGGERPHDQIFEDDRPARHEAPQLVERVARERGRAALL